VLSFKILQCLVLLATPLAQAPTNAVCALLMGHKHCGGYSIVGGTVLWGVQYYGGTVLWGV
jgi:hypothetical protein